MSKENILNKLKKSVLNYDGESAKEAAKEALEAGIDPIEAIQQGLYPGLKELCDEYERTVYITDMVLASDAFYEGANVLKSNITPEKAKSRKKGVAIIGVSEGDVHDLGKNIVKYLMENPNSTQRKLAKALKLHPSTIHWHTNLLIESNIISAERAGKTVQYQINGPIDIDKLLVLAN